MSFWWTLFGVLVGSGVGRLCDNYDTDIPFYLMIAGCLVWGAVIWRRS